MTNAHKVAYFAEQFPSLSETWVNDEVRFLRKSGVEVRVFSTRRAQKFAEAANPDLVGITTCWLGTKRARADHGIALRLLKKNWKAFIWECSGVRQRVQVARDIMLAASRFREVEQYAPDFVMAHFGGTRASLGLLYKQTFGVSFGIKYHASDVFRPCALERSKIDAADILLSISKYNVDYFARTRKWSPARFIIHRCGVDLEKLTYIPRPTRRNKFAIVAVGRLVEQKGFDILIDACGKLASQEFPFSLTIIGDGHLRKKLEVSARKNKISNDVIFTGAQSPAQVLEALREADVFALPCRPAGAKADGIPVAIMEAMACGVPVISTRVSGIPELVIDGVTGFLVNHSDAAGLAQKIAEVAQLENVAVDRISKTARNLIEGQYSAKSLATDLCGLIANLTKVGGGFCLNNDDGLG